MADYPGSNSEATMEGNEKETYAKKVARFYKLRKLLKEKK